MAELSVVGQDRSELFRFKVGMIPTLAVCCGAGIVLFLLGALA